MDMPQILSPSSSGRRTRTSNASNSPEFEFWMVRNPSFPEPNLHSADELFSDGVLLPLHSLPNQSNDPPDPLPESPITDPVPGPGLDTVAEVAEPAPPPEESLITTLTASKRWKDIFKKNTHESKNQEDKEKEKEIKKERKSGGTGGGANGGSAAELNIYLWPFSRSRSAGTGGSRARMATAASTRKVSSAPCSRSNSAGESKSRKWPSSPSRAGVHLGRSSPVWQVRRSGSGRSTAEPLVRNAEKGMKKEGKDTSRSKPAATVAGGGGGGKAEVLNMNVPTCIGYGHHMGCRSDENSATNIATARGGNAAVGSRSAGIGAGERGRGSNLFNLRNLFSKKVY